MPIVIWLFYQHLTRSAGRFSGLLLEPNGTNGPVGVCLNHTHDSASVSDHIVIIVRIVPARFLAKKPVSVWHVLGLVATPYALLKPQDVNRIRILIADDFPEWRVRLRSTLQARPEWQVVGEACNGLEAVQRTLELRPDVVLLDIGMPVLNGIEAAKQIRQAFPDTRIFFVTQENDADIRTEALNVGAERYLLKTNVTTELLPAVEAVLGMPPLLP